MCENEASGQQAVEHLRAVLRASQNVAYRDATGLRFGDAIPAYANAVEFLRALDAAPIAPSTAAGERDTEALAEFLNSECEFADGLTGTSWPQHSHDDGYRGGGGYVRLAPPDVVARRREDAKAILSFLSQRRTAAPTAPSTAAGEAPARMVPEALIGAAMYLAKKNGSMKVHAALARIMGMETALATPPAQEDARYSAIYRTIRYFSLTNMRLEGSSDPYPLVDAMTCRGKTIGDGEDQMRLLADEIYAVLAADTPTAQVWEDRGEVVREAIASVFDEGSDGIIALRDASPFHSVSHDALTTYANNLAGWAQQIRDMPLPPPAPTVPWQEQAAQQCEEWAAASTKGAMGPAPMSERVVHQDWAVRYSYLAKMFRALLSKPAKGE